MRTYNYTADILSQLDDACDLETDSRELERLCGNARAEIVMLRGKVGVLLSALKGYIDAADNSCNPSDDDDVAAMIRFGKADKNARNAIAYRERK